MTRQTKTPAQRAQEAVDVLHRRLHRLEEQRRAARQQIDDLGAQYREVSKRLQYALANPDLPEQPPTNEETDTDE